MRITTAFRLSGTKSFRRAASKLFGTYGTNLQNPSHTLMESIEADPGKILLQADQDGAEARVVAHEAAYGNYRELFQVGVKPHTYLALQVFIDKFRGEYPRDRYYGKTPAQLVALPEWRVLDKFIKKDPANEREYKLGKLTAHAKSYDMGPRTFQINVLEKSEGAICLTFAQAKEYLGMFETLFPEVIEWQRNIKERLFATRELRNLFGYPRHFYGKWNDGLVREAYSWIPQSTVGIITSLAICELGEFIDANDLDWDILNDKHDSIMMQVPIAEKLDGARALHRALRRPLRSTTGVDYFMEAEVSSGPNWNSMSPISL